jgi:hypothetical protein
MGNVSFPDRFELFELLRDGPVQTFRARERSTGRLLEAHFSALPELLADLDSSNVIERGSHAGNSYVVAVSPAGTAPLDSAGAWRIRTSAPPAPHEPMADQAPGTSPGDFTRMFQLRLAPEPVMAAAPKVGPPQAAMSQPGEFTRAFQKPAMAPSATPVGSPEPGQPGEFTRMFQQPAAPAVSQIPDNSVPASPAPASQPRGVLIVIAIAVLSAIVVFVLVRKLY